MALIIKRNSMPAADALVADAVKAVPALNDFEKSRLIGSISQLLTRLADPAASAATT